MAFIKRSKTTPVKVKVGTKMKKCSVCGKPFVQTKENVNTCPECISVKH